MSDILTLFLLVSSLITGIFWFYFRMHAIKNYLINTKGYKNNNSCEKKIIISNNKKYFFQSLASFFPIFLIVFIVRSFIYEPFQIPSGSMMPTLLIGDFILVEKFSYGIREPITHKILMHTNLPQRGDVVVFRHPDDQKTNYIKRVIGIPGDQITYDIHSKKIKVLKSCTAMNNCQKKIFIHYSKSKLSNFFQKIYFFNKKKLNKEKKIYNSVYFHVSEENLNGLKHNIFLLENMKNKKKYYHQRDLPKFTWIVPKNKYFMMGDNRDNSLDSRYWGFVPEQNLVGKAIKIWISFNKRENEWPTGIRLNRIGNIH